VRKKIIKQKYNGNNRSNQETMMNRDN